MVVFTCNNCGDSVKKPKVEKHISVECKKKKYAAVSLCCVDCLVDFNDQTYSVHTKCVTELERYSGKGFVPKASTNKGEKKQNSWVNVVRSVLDKPNLTSTQKQLLKIISNFENVPRKKNKFKNFIGSSVKHTKVNPLVVDEIFDLLEKEFKCITSVQNQNVNGKESDAEGILQNGETKGNTDKENDLNENSTKVVNETEYKSNNKNKKKRVAENNEKYDDKVDTTVESNNKLNLTENNSEILDTGNNENSFQVVTKKKKKKKRDENNENQETFVKLKNENVSARSEEEETINYEILNNKEIRKKKNKKNFTQHSQLNISESCNSVTENIESDNQIQSTEQHTVIESSTEFIKKDDEECTENLSKKEKKKRKKQLKYETILSNIALENNELEVDKCETLSDKNETKKKKKKRKLSEGTDVVQPLDKKAKFSEIIENNENENNSNSCNKFDWNFVIKSLLEKSDGEITLKRMTKKVVNEYHNCCDDSKTYEEIVKIFNKKLSKLPYVAVFKERVKLCAL